jgi:beta-galactosidase
MATASTANRLHLGSAYYPEQWPEARWPEDIRLMQQAGLTVVRMGEFAWSTMEPEAGAFDLDWLERAISALASAGIATVLGTPTAGPPAWLVQQHPDLMAMAEDGRRVQFGNRCHYCVNSPEFHEATRRIVGAMAERFASNPHVIGWQIDNEFNRVCYCDRCRGLFQAYLAERFGSLEALNAAWATRYWSQTYSAWEQIPLPVGPHNPGLMLALRHFVTESYRRFQRLQIDLLRPRLQPGVWITHNLMGWHEGLDYYAMTEDLDLAAWDWYIPSGHHDYLTSGAIHDLARGFKRQNFWLIETQPGNVNWSEVNNTLDKGEARVMAWHAIAHGADAVLYWQWRSALNGQEQYHGTLVDQSGQPRPFYAEAQQLGQELAKISPLLAGSSPVAEVALLNSYDSRWAIGWQRHHREFDYVAHFNNYYRPLAARNVGTDVISADAPLEGFRLVIAPALLLVTEKQVAQMRKFVERGGHLVLTLRTGMKDGNNALLPARQPGPLADLAGVEVEDYYALLDPVPVQGNWFSGQARVWAERLKVRDEKYTSPIARYGVSNGWLDDQLAISVHAVGRGLVYFVGAYLDEVAQQALIDRILETAVVRPVMKSPPGVEVRRRMRPEGDPVWIVINHERAAKCLLLPWPAQDHLKGQRVSGELMLLPYGVSVLTPTD